MKVHLLKTNLEQPLRNNKAITALLFIVLMVISVKTTVHAEGSRNFLNYDGYRMFLHNFWPARKNYNQIKVFARAGETINVGGSHVGMEGGYIDVYSPRGQRTRFSNSGATSGLGVIYNRAQEAGGPIGTNTANPAADPNGYVPATITVPNDSTGVWTVVFRWDDYDSNNSFTNILNTDNWSRAVHQQDAVKTGILAWDVTVTQGGAGNNGGTPVNGRVYTNEHISIIWGNRAFVNGVNILLTTSPKFYVLTRGGYQYEVDIKEANPFLFPISSNSRGLVEIDANGNIVPLYKSKLESEISRGLSVSQWSSGNNYLYEVQARDTGALINNKIFFSPPDPLMDNKAMVYDFPRDDIHETWLFNQRIDFQLNQPIQLFATNSNGTPCNPGSIQFGKGGHFIFDTNLSGVVTLNLDLNNDPNDPTPFDDPEDVVLTGVLGGGIDSLFWDGLNGLMQPLGIQDSFNLKFQGSIRYGEAHIALADVEGNEGGVTFKLLNPPPGQPADQFYYDHSDIGGPISGATGIGADTIPKPTNIPYTYGLDTGNIKYIDQWFFIEFPLAADSFFINIAAPCVCETDDFPVIVASSLEICQGEELILSATNANTQNNIGPIDYVWTGPGHLYTDLAVDPAGTSIDTVSLSADSTNTGTYTIIATTEASCSDTLDINVTVKLTPVLTTDNFTVGACFNGGVTLCANNTTAGIPQLFYEWTGPIGVIDTGTVNGDDEICVTLTNLTADAQYTLVTSYNGCDSEPLIFGVDVQPTPEICCISANADYCVGENVVLTAANNVPGTGDIVYCWTGPNFSLCDTITDETAPFSDTLFNIQLADAGTYELVLTTLLGGCTSTPASVTIGVNPVPIICNVTGGGDACIGQNVTLSGFNCEPGLLGSISYVWTGPAGAALCSGTANNDGPYICDILNVQPLNSGTYCLTLTDDSTNCSAPQQCVEINVLPNIPPPTTTPDSSYCEGSTVTLMGTTNFGDDFIYTWTGPNGNVLISAQVTAGTPMVGVISDLSAADTGVYILTIASLDGCASDPAFVFVGMFDGIDISAEGGGTFCDNLTPITLTGTGVGNSPMVEFLWTGPAGDTIVIDSTVATGPFNASVDTPVSGTYTLTVTTPEGCSDVDSVLVEFVAPPSGNILIPSTDTILCELDTLTLCAQNTNPDVGDFIYTWSTPSGETITGTGNGTAPFCDELFPANTYGEGTYTLVICDGDCCSEPVSVDIFFHPNPVTSLVLLGGPFCEGDTALVCISNTNPAVTDWFYTCIINGTQITQTGTGTNEECIEITEPTTICCSLESADGCVSSLVCLDVDFEPNYTPVITVDSTICANDTLQLNGTNPSSCTGTVSYTWTGPGGYSFTGTAPCEGPFPAIDPNPESGEYCLDLESGGLADCSMQVCTTVVVFEVPFIVDGTISGGGEFCDADTVILSATIENPSGGDIFYEWTQNGDVVASGTAMSGDNISLEVSTPNLGDGNYCLNLTCVDTGCSEEGLGCTQVTLNETPIIDFTSGQGVYCEGEDVLLNGSGPVGTGTVTYTWIGPNFNFTGSAPCGGPYPATINNIDVDQAGVYTLTVTKGDCVSEGATLLIEVNPTPEITNTSGSGEECAGVMTTISFTIDPNGANSVDWAITGPALDTSGTVTVATDFDFDVTVNGDMEYTITAISDENCPADTVVITITEIMVPVPVITVDIPDPCPGETITLSTTPVPGALYTWCLNGAVIPGSTSGPTLVLTNPEEGSYTVKITVNGCPAESAPYVLIYPPAPIASDDSFTTNAGVPVSGNILANDDTANGVTVAVVSQPSNGSVTVSENGEITYTPDDGFSGTDQFTYEICSIECPDDCDEAIVTIIVETPPCEIPNVITPDGDGINDLLIIDCVPGFPNNRLRIFNRWGDEIEVFEPYANTWDGTTGSGKDPVPAGTYFYLFQEDRSRDDHQAGYIKVVR